MRVLAYLTARSLLCGHHDDHLWAFVYQQVSQGRSSHDIIYVD